MHICHAPHYSTLRNVHYRKRRKEEEEWQSIVAVRDTMNSGVHFGFIYCRPAMPPYIAMDVNGPRLMLLLLHADRQIKRDFDLPDSTRHSAIYACTTLIIHVSDLHCRRSQEFFLEGALLRPVWPKFEAEDRKRAGISRQRAPACQLGGLAGAVSSRAGLSESRPQMDALYSPENASSGRKGHLA